MQALGTPQGWVDETETVIDREELRALRIDAYSWRAQQESYRKHGATNGICPYCGNAVSTTQGDNP